MFVFVFNLWQNSMKRKTCNIAVCEQCFPRFIFFIWLVRRGIVTVSGFGCKMVASPTDFQSAHIGLAVSDALIGIGNGKEAV